MANNALVTTRMVTFKVLDEFLNNLKVVSGFSTEWEAEFGKQGNKIGDTLLVRKPQRWLVKSGATYQEQPITDTFTTITVLRQRFIGFDYGAFESTLSLDDMYNRYFAKQTTQLSNQVDDEASQFAYQNTNNITGTLGTNPASLADAQNIFLDGYAQLMENGCPTEDLTGVFWPAMAAAIMKFLNTNFNPQPELRKQFMSGNLIENMYGFARIAVDQNLYIHTAGTFTGTPVVQTASVDGDTQIVVNGWTANTDFLNAGDVFAVASVNNVNPKNRRTMGRSKKFVVQNTVTADGNGSMTIVFGGNFSLAGPGNQYQNVDALPAAGAAITVWPGTTSPSNKSGNQSLEFGPNAFAFVPITFPNVGEEGAFCSQATDPKTRASLTMVRQVNAETYRRIARMDMGFDFGNLYPDNESVRAVGA